MSTYAHVKVKTLYNGNKIKKVVKLVIKIMIVVVIIIIKSMLVIILIVFIVLLGGYAGYSNRNIYFD
jgi:ABC-type bacteriocin/lantibiotic exporter with double-glycine peptidase domain